MNFFKLELSDRMSMHMSNSFWQLSIILKFFGLGSLSTTCGAQYKKIELMKAIVAKILKCSIGS